MRCPRCQSLLSAGVQTCPVCDAGGTARRRPAPPAAGDGVLPAASKGKRGTVLGILALVAAIAFKGKGLLLFALTKLKFVLGLFKLKSLLAVVKSGGTMLLMIGVYAFQWPLSFAIGFTVLILIHELGHAMALRMQGIRFSAPIFIPFVGALIGLKEMPPDAGKEALVAWAGPFTGTIGAQACLVLFHRTGHPVFLGLAQVGFLLNLFNLIPFSPLDGGRIVGAISPKIWLFALPAVIIAGLWMSSFILLLVGILGIPRAIKVWRSDPESQAYFQVPARVRWTAAAGYLALGGFLAYMMDYTEGLHAALGG